MLISVTIFLVVLSSIGCLCFAETGFAPGAALREYLWYGPWVNASKFQRVTDPKARHSGAKEFLPNPVNRITIDDLDLAVKVEVCIESLQCHTGTHKNGFD